VADALVPLPRFVTGRFPVTPVERGSPVAFVRVAEAIVPSAVELPDGSSCGILPDVNVVKTFLVPDVNITAELELEER
jgi:hypothetical protein